MAVEEVSVFAHFLDRNCHYFGILIEERKIVTKWIHNIESKSQQFDPILWPFPYCMLIEICRLDRPFQNGGIFQYSRWTF